MILEDNKRDYVEVEGGEETTKMSISADVTSHIIKILTEHSYDDPLGSAIRETVSNAVDSVTESSLDNPVIVKIEITPQNRYELSIEDKGLGLDDASFKKYIMGIGESTKRHSTTLLGGYGAGAKAWLAYTDNFSYVCRKDGVERKYLIFKGEEYPESTLLYEQPTTEVNGVKVSVLLKINWRELTDCHEKIKQQLAYLPNVWYEIPSWDNTYPIYQHEDFQFSPLHPEGQMHISLKNIAYPIDWGKLGLTPIYMNVALRFDDYESIRPIYNRENIQYTQPSIAAIKEKLVKVLNYFANLWTETIGEYSTMMAARPTVNQQDKYVWLFGNKFNVKGIDTVPGVISLSKPCIKGINILSTKWLCQNDTLDRLLGAWEVHYVVDGYTAKSSNKIISYHNSHRYIKYIENGHFTHIHDYILVDFTIVGYLKTYIVEKYPYCIVVRKSTPRKLGKYRNSLFGYGNTYGHILSLDKYPKEEWRQRIQEFQTVEKTIEESFINLCGLDNTQEYKDWVAQRKKDIKEGRIATSNYKALNKEKGDITLHTARLAIRTSEKPIVYDKSKIKIADLSKHFRGSLVVYTSGEVDFPKKWIALRTNRVKFIKFNEREVQHVKNLNHFITMEQFKKSKPLARIATAMYIDNMLKQEIDEEKMELVGLTFTTINKLKVKLEEYTRNNSFYADKEVIKAIIEEAKANNNWDFSIYSDVVAYKKELDKYGFLSAMEYDRHIKSNPEALRLIKNIIYIMLKAKKITGHNLEDMELVPRQVKESTIVVDPPIEEEEEDIELEEVNIEI